MKSTILVSLLLLGVCFAEKLESDHEWETQKWREMLAMREIQDTGKMSNWNSDQSMDKRNGGYMENTQRGSQRQNVDNKRQNALSDIGSIKDYVSGKISDLFHFLHKEENSNAQVATVYDTKVPSFADPLNIGSLTDKLALLKVEYKNVQVDGLRNIHHVMIHVDADSKKVSVSVPFVNVQIKGQYVASNLLKHASGDFHVSLGEGSNYVIDIPYEYKNGQIQFGAASGQVQNVHLESKYESIGFVAKIFQDSLAKNLIRAINQNMYDELYHKMESHLHQQVEDISKNLRRARVVSLLEVGINQTVKEIRETISQYGDVSLNLDNEGEEIEYSGLHARVKSVNLFGLQNFNLSRNHISFNDKIIQADVQLSVANAKAIAVVSYSTEHKSNVPSSEVSAEYIIPEIHASIEMTKELGVTGVQLQTVRVQANQIYISPSQKSYEEKAEKLVKHLPSSLESHINHYLQRFIQSEINVILSKGFLEPPPSSRHIN